MLRASASGVGFRLLASRFPVRSFAKFRRAPRSNKDESSVLSDQHVTLILSDSDAVQDLLSAVLGRVVSLAEKPIAPRTLHLRGVPGKAKEFSYDCFAVLRDPSAAVKGVSVAHVFRHALIEGQNDAQNYVAPRALMHSAIDRYESFVARIIDRLKNKAKKSPAPPSSQSPGTPALAQPAVTPLEKPSPDATDAVAAGLGASGSSSGDSDGAHQASASHPTRSPVQYASFGEFSPSVVVTIQDYAPIALRVADVRAAASSRHVPDAVLDAWCAARTVPGSAGTLVEHLAENFKHGTGVLTVDVRIDLPRDTFVLPAKEANAGGTKAEELSYVLLTIPVAGFPLPVTSVKFAVEAPVTFAPSALATALQVGAALVAPGAAAPLAGAAPLGAAPLSTPLASGYEPSDVAYLRNHDNYIFVYLPLLVCLADFAPLKHLWRHGGGGSADDLDRLHKWALLLRHKPASPKDAPPLVRGDDLLNRLLLAIEGNSPPPRSAASIVYRDKELVDAQYVAFKAERARDDAEAALAASDAALTASDAALAASNAANAALAASNAALIAELESRNGAAAIANAVELDQESLARAARATDDSGDATGLCRRNDS